MESDDTEQGPAATVMAEASVPAGDGALAATAAETPPTPITPETVFEVLSNERRRHVLHYLKSRGERVTVRELSEQVAAWENGIASREVTPTERKRVYTALHQTHLPKMASVGVIDYDRDRGTLALTDAVEAFDIYLEIVPRSELSWGEFYLSLGTVATALVTVAALGFYPFSVVSGFGYALVVAVGLLVTGAVHTYSRRRDRVGTGDPTDIEVLYPRE